jgi:UDP-glucose 4-epimerase
VKKVLITGGAGNIGSSLVRGLLETDKHHVTVLDNLSTGSIQNLPENSLENFNFVNGDVNRLKDVNKIFNDYNFDYVFHYAALVGVERTQKNPLKVLEDI